jgi:hypothetical protein
MSVDDATPRLRNPFTANAYMWASARVSMGVDDVLAYLRDEGQFEHEEKVRDLFDSLVQMRLLYIQLAGLRIEAWKEGLAAGVSAPANRALGLGNPVNPYIPGV